MLVLRLGFTAAAMAVVVWLLAAGRPLGGLVIAPLVAVWIRRAAERRAAESRRKSRALLS
jgi:ethanolamine transporter EutH